MIRAVDIYGEPFLFLGFVLIFQRFFNELVTVLQLQLPLHIKQLFDVDLMGIWMLLRLSLLVIRQLFCYLVAGPDHGRNRFLEIIWYILIVGDLLDAFV